MFRQLFYRLICFALISLSALSVYAKEPLQRKGTLGLMPVSQSGKVEIAQLLPNGTADTMGVKAGDTIEKLNGQTVNDFAALIQQLSHLYAEDKVVLEMNRGDQSLTLKGRLQGRPKERSELAKVIYDSVDYNDVRLRSILHLPNKSAITDKNGTPAIYFIQGYTCSSIDYGAIPNVTTRQMIDQFVAAGFAVFRVDKLGVGDSQSTQHCRDVDFNTELEGFVAGLAQLKSNKMINPDKVYLWGHSLGVLYAPAIATNHKVAGIIGYGGVAKPWYDYMLDIFEKQSTKYWGVSQNEAGNNSKIMKPFLMDWLNSDKDWQAIAQSKSNQPALKAQLLPINDGYILSRHFGFFRSINQIDFSKLWKQIEVPTLMIHGSLDIQAINEKWAYKIADWVNHSNNNQLAKAAVLEGTEHGFMRYNSRQELMRAMSEGTPSAVNPGKHFDPRVGNLTINWLQQINADTNQN